MSPDAVETSSAAGAGLEGRIGCGKTPVMMSP